MSSSNNSQSPPNSPFGGTSNANFTFDSRRYDSATGYYNDFPTEHGMGQAHGDFNVISRVAASQEPLYPSNGAPRIPDFSEQAIRNYAHGMPAPIAGVSAGNMLPLYQTWNMMGHVAQGMRDQSLAYPQQQNLQMGGISPAALLGARPAYDEAFHAGIQNAGQLHNAAALFGNHNYARDLREATQMEYGNLFQQYGGYNDPTDPNRVARAYNSVAQSALGQASGLFSTTTNDLRMNRQGTENYAQTATRMMVASANLSVGSTVNDINAQFRSLDPLLQERAQHGLTDVNLAEIATGMGYQTTMEMMRSAGREGAQPHLTYADAMAGFITSDEPAIRDLRSIAGVTTRATHQNLPFQPLALTADQQAEIRDAADDVASEAFGVGMHRFENDPSSNAHRFGGGAGGGGGGGDGFGGGTSGGGGDDDGVPNLKQFIQALNEATQGLRRMSGATGAAGAGGGASAIDPEGLGAAGGGMISLENKGFGRTSGFLSAFLTGSQGLEADTEGRRKAKFAGRLLRGAVTTGFGIAAGAGGNSVESFLGSVPGFSRGFEGAGILREAANMSAGGELPTMQASALLGFGTGYADMRQGMGGVGNMAAGAKYGISAEAMGQLFLPLASAAGGGPLDIQKTLGGYAAGEDVGGYYQLMGQQRQAGITSGHAMEFNAAKARGLKGSAATGFASSLYGAFASIDASMNMGQDRGTLEGQLLASGRGNIQRGAGVFQRGAGVFRGAKDFLLSPFQGVSDILLANEALAATGSYTGAVDRLEAGEAQGGRGARGRLNRMVGSELGGLLMRQKGLSGRDLRDIDRKATALGADDEPAFDQAGDTSGGATKASAALAGRRNEQIDGLYSRFQTFEKLLKADSRVEKMLLQRLDQNIDKMDGLITTVEKMTKSMDKLIFGARDLAQSKMLDPNAWDATKILAMATYIGVLLKLGVK